MTYQGVVADQRLLARFINLAHRCGCRFAQVEARTANAATTFRIDFTGDAEALRRLFAQLDRLVEDDRLRLLPAS